MAEKVEVLDGGLEQEKTGHPSPLTGVFSPIRAGGKRRIINVDKYDQNVYTYKSLLVKKKNPTESFFLEERTSLYKTIFCVTPFKVE